MSLATAAMIYHAMDFCFEKPIISAPREMIMFVSNIMVLLTKKSKIESF